MLMLIVKRLVPPLAGLFLLFALMGAASYGDHAVHHTTRQPSVTADGFNISFLLNGPLPTVTLGGLGVMMLGYTGVSMFMAKRLAYETPKPIETTPAACGLEFCRVTFPSRGDHITLRGWLIPGALPDGTLSLKRTIIAVHGARQNRTDPAAGLSDLCCRLAHQGFAVLVFDLRGHGESASAPFTLGYYEQRDVLGAVDFLRSGALPYPELGRPQYIGGWGISSGANALLLAAAHEPALQALVADSAYPDMLPILEREVPRESRLPPIFTRGALLAARLLYGLDYRAIRPIDALAGLAPRPLLLIQGGADTFNPPANLALLAAKAASAPSARVESWQVAGAAHAQSFHTEGEAYIQRITRFFTAAFASDESSTSSTSSTSSEYGATTD
jgi:fermentation-respiration switch protein FrsA (DUF1100 family)